MRAAEIVVPAEILTQFVDPPAPKVEPAPPAPPTPVLQKKTVTKAPVLPQPQPPAIADPTPSPNAPTGVITPPVQAAPVAAVAAAPAAPTAPPQIEAPVVDASYTPNEEVFRKPNISVRLGESGRILLSVTVGIHGFATNVTLIKSSGYPRLDDAAIRGARKLKFRPATRAGVPIEMTRPLPVIYLAETN